MKRLIAILFLLIPAAALANGHAYGFVVMRTADLKKLVAEAGGLDKVGIPGKRGSLPIVFQGQFGTACGLSLWSEGHMFRIKLSDPASSPLKYALTKYKLGARQTVDSRGTIDSTKLTKNGPPVVKEGWEKEDYVAIFHWVEFLK